MRIAKLIPITIIIITSLITIAFAGVSDYSFRIAGMGKPVLDFTHDSYSNVFYNPAYIANIDGLHVYTNLSNLGNIIPASILGNEISMLKDAIYPSNLVGFMGRWKFLSGGAFYVTEGYNIGFEETGSDEDKFNWGDSVSLKYTSKYNENSEFIFGGRQIIGIGTINLFGFKLGVMGKLKTFKSALTFESEDVGKDYQDGQLIYNKTSSYTNNIETGTTFMGLIVGTLIGGGNTELSISGGIQPGGASFSSKFIDEWVRKPYYQTGYYEYDQDPSENFRLNYDDSILDFSMVGSEVFGNVRLMKKIGSATRTSIFGRVSTAFFPIDITDEFKDKYERKRPDSYHDYGASIDTSYGDYYLDQEFSKRNGEGSFNFFQIKGGIGFEHQFVNNTLFILGVKGNFVHIGGKIDVDPRTTERIYKDLENNPSYQDFGYVETINYRNPFTMEGSGNILFLEIPSALEFNISDMWKFRIGANQILPIYGNGKYLISSKDDPNEVKIQYTNGPDADTTVITEDEDEGSSNSEDEIKITSTNFNMSRYYTGLGYQVNENVTVDIIHYTNLTNLGMWYLSFSVHF